jgi:hypothetical protein
LAAAAEEFGGVAGDHTILDRHCFATGEDTNTAAHTTSPAGNGHAGQGALPAADDENGKVEVRRGRVTAG